jgi:PAS domain S-box-containing protein
MTLRQQDPARIDAITNSVTNWFASGGKTRGKSGLVLRSIGVARGWHPLARIAIMLTGVAAATLIQSLGRTDVPGNPFLLFFAVVFASAVAFGHVPGFLAVAVTSVVSLLFVEPVFSFAVWNAADMLAIEIYTALAIFSVWASDRIVDGALAEINEHQIARRNAAAALLSFVVHMPVPVAVFDRQMRYLAASERWMRDFRLTDREIIGKCHYDVFPTIPERWKDVHRRCLSGETLKADEDSFIRSDGMTDWLRWDCSPWHKDDGTIGGILLVAEVITARKEAELALRKREERLRLAQASANVGIWDLDLRTNELTWTPELETMYRLKPGSVKSYADFRDRVHPHDIEEMEASRDAAIGKRERFRLEFRIVRADGRVRWLSATGGAIYDEVTGEPIRVLGGNVDITDRKRAEEARRTSETRFRAFFDNAAVGAAQIDQKGRFAYVNERYCGITGYSRDELIGRMGPLDLDHPDDIETDRTHILGYFEAAIPYHHCEKRYVRKDARVVWVRVSVAPIGHETGSVLATAAIIEDITERKQAEAALRESEVRFRNIFEHVATGIAITDLEGRFEHCNPAYCALLGYNEEEFRQMNFALLVHPDDRETNLVHNRQLLGGEVASFDIENRYRHKDGRSLWVRKYVSLLPDQSGKLAHVIVLVTEMTDRNVSSSRLSATAAPGLQ